MTDRSTDGYIGRPHRFIMNKVLKYSVILLAVAWIPGLVGMLGVIGTGTRQLRVYGWKLRLSSGG